MTTLTTRALVTALVALIAFTGCGSEDKESDASTTATTTATAQQTPVAEAVSVDDYATAYASVAMPPILKAVNRVFVTPVDWDRTFVRAREASEVIA